MTLYNIVWKHTHDLGEPVLDISKSLLKLGSSFVYIGLFIGGIQLLSKSKFWIEKQKRPT